MTSSFRLLVFGGTGFIERSRVGEWPQFPPGMLSDAYGLGSGAPSMGIGIRDGRPFIVYRESQQQRDRSYPYWLLLDPGDVLWQRFGWNGPLIVASLSRTPLWQRLREEPEQIEASDARDVVDALVPPQSETPSRADNAFLDFLVGAAILDSPVSVCSPADCTNRSAESLEDLARSMQQAAPAFRVGRGWLVGGAPAHGKELGCAAVVDPRSAANAGATSIARGHSFLDNIHTIEGSPYSAALTTILAEPLFRWSSDTTQLVIDLAELLSGAEEAVNWGRINFANVPWGLATEFMQAALREPSEPHAFSSERTQFLIAQMLAGDLQPNVDLSRWHLKTVAAAIANKPVPFDRFIATTSLSSELSLELWRHYAGDVKEATLLSDLNSLGQVLDESTLDQFVGVALLHIPSSTPLDKWSLLSLPPAASARIKAALGSQVISRAIARQPGWEIDFIIFSDDVGGAVSRASLSSGEVAALVRAALDMTGPARQRATDFLAGLAQLPFRPTVPLGLKRAAASRAPAPWRDFSTLLDLWDGRALIGTMATPSTRDMLFVELRDLIREEPLGSEPPNLAGLVAFMGSNWPSETLAALRVCRPAPFTRASARKWIDGWKSLDADWASAEEARMRRVVITQMFDNPDGGQSIDDLRKVPKAELAEAASDYIATVPTPDEVARRATNVVVLAQRHPQTRSAFELFLQQESQSVDSLFVEAMFHDAHLLALSTAMASQESANGLFDAMARADHDAFSELVIDCFVRPAREPVAKQAAAKIVTFVESTQPSVLRRVIRSVYGGNASECRAALNKLKKGRK